MSKSAMSLYNRLPYSLKVMALNLKGFLNNRQRYNSDFKKYLSQYLSNWYGISKDINASQRASLLILLSEVYQHSNWYSSKMKALDISLEDIQTDPYAVLDKMPILEKKHRKENVLDLSNESRKTAMVHYTSGTSGTPTVDYIDTDSINRSFAFWKRFHHVIGIDRRAKQVRLSGRLIVSPSRKKAPFWVFNRIENQLLMSTYHLTEKNIGKYIQKLNNFKPELIDGYPSAVYILSKFIIENNIELDFIPKAIAVTAETLFDYHRDTIQKAFKCHVFNQYASNEGSPLITECTAGGLHLNIDSGVFEFLSLNGIPAKPGEMAQLIVTSFINYKTPLIRYRIGDTVLLPEVDTDCSCGCEMPMVEKILGRDDDILWTEEKGFVGRMDTAYKGLTGMEKSQIIQESPTNIIVNLIANDKYDEKIEQEFIQNLRDRLGNNIKISINKVNDIQLSSNGKFIAVKRKFEIPQLNS
ncbi:phenylacetate--CoA ligase family protein [Spongiivirga citrea]|uniref:Phenylacetate--CoA ligase family protein n=1 Tax=Spongiivirga citrea TaxID=1481457 RepID=A0A6M0CCP7_9FLAO|nr:phenylacetate--CoA ligase family protein [Spongiivirga citrea]NER15576.1 hypothetical protein [Spongiivirga citrea]